jgi:hypothetical protein
LKPAKRPRRASITLVWNQLPTPFAVDSMTISPSFAAAKRADIVASGAR